MSINEQVNEILSYYPGARISPKVIGDPGFEVLIMGFSVEPGLIQDIMFLADNLSLVIDYIKKTRS